MPSRSRLSPRYITKGPWARKSSAVSSRVGEAERLGLRHVGDAGAEREPSPTASRISSPVSGAITIPISVIPASTSASIP